MGILGDKLIQLIKPKQREVWFVDDSEIRLHPGQPSKNRRPVLIASSINLLNEVNYPLLNVIPLSRQTPGKYIFPIARAYEEKADGFEPDENSCAIIPFYQPIELKYFKQRCGTIDETTYEAIIFLLCLEIVGCDCLDIDP